MHAFASFGGLCFSRDVCVCKLNVIACHFIYISLYFLVNAKLKNLNELSNCLFNLEYRTKEQLGYVVECSPRVTYRVYGFCFCIQSSKYSPVYLQERTDNFINSLADLLVSVESTIFSLHALLYSLCYPLIKTLFVCFYLLMHCRQALMMNHLRVIGVD